MLLIYSLTLPLTQDVTNFIDFIEKKYFSAVRTGPTRVGQVLGLKLLFNKDTSDEMADKHNFLVLADWSGLAMGQVRVEDDAVAKELDAFGAILTKLGAFDEVARFKNPDSTN